MPDETLHGNHDPCPACQLRREAEDKRPINRPLIPCNTCAGLGFIPISAAEIIARTTAEACQTYWPQFEQRIAQHKGQPPCRKITLNTPLWSVCQNVTSTR